MSTTTLERQTSTNNKTKSKRRSAQRRKQSQKQSKNVTNDPVIAEFDILEFNGELHYLIDEHEVQKMCENVPKDIVLGFDLEWKPNYRKGVPPNKVALVQLCYLHEEQLVCMVIHCHVCGIPKALENILTDERFKKAGLGSTQDAKLLKRDFDITMKGVEDIGAISMRKDLSGVIESGKKYSGSANGLVGLCERLVGKTMFKKKSIRCGNWERVPLSDAQVQYAATDAYASLLCYNELQKLPDKPVQKSKKQETETEPHLPKGEIMEKLFVKETNEDVKTVHNLFMGIGKPQPTGIAQIGFELDINSQEVYSRLAKAILSGLEYSWQRMKIANNQMVLVALAVRVVLLNSHPTLLEVTDSATGSTASRHIHTNVLSAMIADLKSIVEKNELADWKSSIIDFHSILEKSEVHIGDLKKTGFIELNDAKVRATLAHIGRLVTLSFNDM